MSQHRRAQELDEVVQAYHEKALDQRGFWGMLVERLLFFSESTEEADEAAEGAMEGAESFGFLHKLKHGFEQMSHVLGPLRAGLLGLVSLVEVTQAIRTKDPHHKRSALVNAGLTVVSFALSVTMVAAALTPIGIATMVTVGSFISTVKAYRERKEALHKVREHEEKVIFKVQKKVHEDRIALEKTLEEVSSLRDLLSETQDAKEQQALAELLKQSESALPELKTELNQSMKAAITSEKHYDYHLKEVNNNAASVAFGTILVVAGIVGIFAPPVGLGIGLLAMGGSAALAVGNSMKRFGQYVRGRFAKRTDAGKKMHHREKYGKLLTHALGETLLNDVKSTLQKSNTQMAAPPVTLKAVPPVTLKAVPKKRSLNDDGAVASTTKKQRVMLQVDAPKPKPVKRKRDIEDDLPLIKFPKQAMPNDLINEEKLQAFNKNEPHWQADVSDIRLNVVDIEEENQHNMHVDLLFAAVQTQGRQAQNDDSEGESRQM